MYYDSNGLIVQQNMDGGDTSGREGDYWYASAFMPLPSRVLNFDEVLTLLQVSPGVFIRNPINYNNPQDFSRDQTTPLILAMGEMGKYETLRYLFWNQCKRFGLYPNGDIGGFEDLGYYIRSFKAWYLYPILILGDLEMLGESIIRIIESKDPNNTSDDINHTLALLQAQKHLATPISWIARKIYKKWVTGGIQSRWDSYFNPASGANEFNIIYRPLISEM